MTMLICNFAFGEKRMQGQGATPTTIMVHFFGLPFGVMSGVWRGPPWFQARAFCSSCSCDRALERSCSKIIN
jgi:hypothetical protein